MKTLKLTLAFLILAGIAASVEAGQDKVSQTEIKTAGLYQNSSFYNGSSYYRPTYQPVGYRPATTRPAMNCSNGICRPVTNTTNCANGQCGLNGTCANGQCGLNGSCPNGNCGSVQCINGKCYRTNTTRNVYPTNRVNYRTPTFLGMPVPRLQSPVTYQRRPVYRGVSAPARNNSFSDPFFN